MPDKLSFGERLKELRKEKGLSLAKLGARCEPRMAPSYINSIENGGIDAMSMSISTIARLAAGLDEPFEMLVSMAFGYEDAEEPSELDQRLIHIALNLTDFRKRDLLEIAEIFYQSQKPLADFFDWKMWDIDVVQFKQTRKKKEA